MTTDQQDKIVDKVRKLLRLSESSNPHEAALAASRAQDLIDQHRLQRALLDSSDDVKESPSDGGQVDSDDTYLDQWRIRLASVLAKHNGCRVYISVGARVRRYRRKEINVVGAPSDVETVRLLFDLLAQDVRRLCKLNSKGQGWTWQNNYRVGVVQGIEDSLKDQDQRFRASTLSNLTGLELVVVQSALQRLDQRQQDTNDWVRRNLRLTQSHRPTGRADFSARDQGRADGRSLNVARGNKQIGAS